jgi:CRP/FNR family cyclic AMP-dependent transcriptional regulator
MVLLAGFLLAGRHTVYGEAASASAKLPAATVLRSALAHHERTKDPNRMPTTSPSFVTQLQQVRLLGGVPGDRLVRASRECRWRSLDDGQIVDMEGADGGACLVVSGCIRVMSHSFCGRQVTLFDRAGGEFFGGYAMGGGRGVMADAFATEPTLVAVEPSRVAIVPPAALARWFAEEEGVAQYFIGRLVDDVRTLSERVIALSTEGVAARLHTEVLRLAFGASNATNIACIDPAPRHGDIAAAIGTSREQVSREFSRLSEFGLVVRAHDTLEVPDVDALVALVRRDRENA